LLSDRDFFLSGLDLQRLMTFCWHFTKMSLFTTYYRFWLGIDSKRCLISSRDDNM